jgi:stage II sporulation protein AA (anti-sigma F factor antagonist)
MTDQGPGIRLTLDKLNQTSCVVHMAGYIDTYNSMYCQKQINPFIQQGLVNIVFDLSGVTYISSTGVGVFTNTLKQVKAEGGDMILVAPRPRVEEVFDLLGFKTFFTRTEIVQEALELLPSVPKMDVPFAKMEALTASFAELEGYIKPSNEIDFYSALLQILRQVEDLKQGVHALVR